MGFNSAFKGLMRCSTIEGEDSILKQTSCHSNTRSHTLTHTHTHTCDAFSFRYLTSWGS